MSRIEGGVNAQLRDMSGNRRGMSAMRRVEAVCRWCCMRAESPKGAAETIRSMPADDDVDLLREVHRGNPAPSTGPVEWGDGLTWSESHHSAAYPRSVG